MAAYSLGHHNQWPEPTWREQLTSSCFAPLWLHIAGPVASDGTGRFK